MARANGIVATIGRMWLVTTVLTAITIAACASPPMSASPQVSEAARASVGPAAPRTGRIPACNDLPSLVADPASYPPNAKVTSDDAIILGIRKWARRQSGFEEIWIDRDQHDGWITLAFSRDAALAQFALAGEFPGIAAVVVEVPWTMRELKDLQQRVVTEMRAGPIVSSGIRPQHGVVSIGVAVLFPDVVGDIDAAFGDERVCIEGADPADVPPDGPQPQGGDGWRLLADQDETGESYRTGIATHPEAYAALWNEARLKGDPPAVDFETEVVIWFGAVHGSSCPRLRLDDVVAGNGLVHAVITRWEFGPCTADAIGHAYLVAVERAMLPSGGFTIQLQAADPPAGVIDTERTVVRADLTVPGATIRPS